MVAASSAPTPGTPLASMVKIYSKAWEVTAMLFHKKAYRTESYCNKYAIEDLTHQWSGNGLFELENLLFENHFREFSS